MADGHERDICYEYIVAKTNIVKNFSEKKKEVLQRGAENCFGNLKRRQGSMYVLRKEKISNYGRTFYD